MKVIIEFKEKENKKNSNQLYDDVKDIDVYDDFIEINQQNEVEEILNMNRVVCIPKEVIKTLDISDF